MILMMPTAATNLRSDFEQLTMEQLAEQWLMYIDFYRQDADLELFSGEFRDNLENLILTADKDSAIDLILATIRVMFDMDRGMDND